MLVIDACGYSEQPRFTIAREWGMWQGMRLRTGYKTIPASRLLLLSPLELEVVLLLLLDCEGRNRVKLATERVINLRPEDVRMRDMREQGSAKWVECLPRLRWMPYLFKGR